MAGNSVIDLSHHNGARLRFDKGQRRWNCRRHSKGNAGRILCRPDLQEEQERRSRCGLLFGAYHFGTGSDGVSQAEHFLETVEPDNKTVVVLDFEDNPAGGSMTLEEARAFVVHIHDKLGRWPGFYSGHTIKRALGTSVDPVLKNCWLWLAQYGPTAVVPPCWTTLTLWQYTDGGVGPPPHSVNGIGLCDRDFYAGTNAQIESWWGT